MNAIQQNGRHAYDTQGKEGGKETCGERSLFYQACAADGNLEREACRRSRIIYVENSDRSIKPFVLRDIATTQEVIQDVATLLEINTYVLGFRISPTREGTWHRQYLDGVIPRHMEDLYVSFYLRKHPR